MRVEEQLLAVINRAVSQHGAHLIEVGLRRERGAPLLQIFIDAVDPVTIDQCSLVSRALSTAIGKEDLLPANYRLEVSTPGLDRPLAFPWQYTKHKGRMLRLVAGEGEQTRTFEGILSETDEQGIELAFADGSRARFPFTTITKATIRTPW